MKELKRRIHYRLARLELREPVPLRIDVDYSRLKRHERYWLWFLRLAAVALSVALHVKFYNYVVQMNKNSNADETYANIPIRAIINEPKEDLEELPKPPEKPNFYTHEDSKGEGGGTAEGPESDIQNPTRHLPFPNQKQNQLVVNSSGILAGLMQPSGATDAMFDNSSLDALDELLEGTVLQSGIDLRGTEGLGILGAGLGGVGTAMHVGGLGTRNLGNGIPHGIGGGPGDGKKTSIPATIIPESPEFLGPPPDKSMIARIINKHLSQIRYCYQRELNKNPNLNGKVTMQFIISGEGTVNTSMVKVSTLRNQAVESCISAIIRTMSFPALKDGRTVVVNYPFLFKAAGE